MISISVYQIRISKQSSFLITAKTNFHVKLKLELFALISGMSNMSTNYKVNKCQDVKALLELMSLSIVGDFHPRLNEKFSAKPFPNRQSA